jgi:hypothetical protein
MKIAFGYKMGVGKDEAVSYIRRKIDGRQISFAGPLYSIMFYAQEVCGFEKQKDRQFLQYVGTEWAREKDPDIWVRLAIENASRMLGNLFLTDLRFPNEFEALKNDGWLCVKINRSSTEGREGSGKKSHHSEKALDLVHDNRWDYIIDNNGTLEEFYKKLDILILKINEQQKQQQDIWHGAIRI